MPTPVEFADRYAAALLARETDTGDAVSRTLQTAEESLATAARNGTPQFRNDLVRELARHLKPDIPSRAFGILANTAGMVVEWGADPGIALAPILDRLPAMLGGTPTLVEQLERHFGTPNIDDVPYEQWRPIAEASEEAKFAVREVMSIRFAGCAA